MSNDRTPSVAPVGTFTVLDMMLFVAASALSLLLMRSLRPPAATWEDYLALAAFCSPAGLSVFGPWAVRRQFTEGEREELHPGEWLWVALGATWLAATPLMAATAGTGIMLFSGLLAVFAGITGLVTLILSLAGLRSRPWTHWAGIVVALLHLSPIFVRWQI
jgi:hypothetical protein